MKKLVLPGEPGRLWIAKRTIIHAIPGLGDQPRIEPHLGGGTVLAGDWKHRESSDIDVFLPGRTTLADLLEDNEDNLLRKLGGRPIRATATQITIQFDRSTLDISTVAPTPTEGQEPREVDGQEEATLSETQILHGKLKRADEMLVRDAFDICTAAGEAAGALASAVNLLEADELGTIQWLYDAGADTLAGDYDEAISGVPTGRELDPKTLGQRGERRGRSPIPKAGRAGRSERRRGGTGNRKRKPADRAIRNRRRTQRPERKRRDRALGQERADKRRGADQGNTNRLVPQRDTHGLRDRKRRDDRLRKGMQKGDNCTATPGKCRQNDDTAGADTRLRTLIPRRDRESGVRRPERDGRTGAEPRARG